MSTIEILKTDKLFTDSPDAGDKKCLCSRCNQKIKRNETAIRSFGLAKNTEYRFCESCQVKSMGVLPAVDDDDEDFWDDDDY